MHAEAPTTSGPRPTFAAPLICGALWLLLIGLATAAKHAAGLEHWFLCLFRRATGAPCPACGSTRAVYALLEARAIEALTWNPLFITALTASAIAFLWRAVTGARPAIGHWFAHKWAWPALLAAVLANWAYVAAYHLN